MGNPLILSHKSTGQWKTQTNGDHSTGRSQENLNRMSKVGIFITFIFIAILYLIQNQMVLIMIERPLISEE